MKQKILFLAILAFSITIVACSSKDSVTGGTTTGTDSNFFPLTTGNYWIYKTPDSSSTRVVKGTKSVNGKTYLEVFDYSDSSSSLDRKEGSKLYSLLPSDFIGTLKEVQLLDEKVGATWSYDLSVLGDLHFAYTTVETGLTRTTNGDQYTEVLHVHLKTTGTSFGFPVDSDADIYYAKGIGEIEITGGNAEMLRTYHVN